VDVTRDDLKRAAGGPEWRSTTLSSAQAGSVFGVRNDLRLDAAEGRPQAVAHFDQ
jgi:hypothetical protein